MVGLYVPDAGDLVWLDFDPQAGREQAGRRPAVVLSAQYFNEKTGVAYVCPITSKVKGYRFHVLLPTGLPVHGSVLCEHMRSLDWRARNATPMARCLTQFSKRSARRLELSPESRAQEAALSPNRSPEHLE